MAAATLAGREVRRFWRQKSRVAGFVGSPLVFWLLIGSGFGDLGFFFPGALTLTVMFSAIFSMMSLIEDRKEGFLLAVLVSPAPRPAIVLGKILGAGALAWVQGLMLLCFLPLTGLRTGAVRVAAVAAALLAISFTFTALGFLFAWKIDSTQGFHAVMNLVLLPLWLVSGALFSISGASPWMQWLMRLNPLTYSVAALKRLLDPAGSGDGPSLAASLGLTISCGLVLWIAATVAASRPPARGGW
jgi:ABC-2 type transport system permease protein